MRELWRDALGCATGSDGCKLRILASPYREKYNPFTSLLYQAMEAQNAEVAQFTAWRLVFGSWDIWHLHWPEQVLGSSDWLSLKFIKFWAKLKIARARKIKIVWTVHNLGPHERRHPWLERMYWRIFLPNLDGIICMTESGREQLHSEHPLTGKLPVFIIPHGHYRGVYPDEVGKDGARQALGIGQDEAVIAFVGQIRGYKGVPHLIRCFNSAALPASRLLIAGESREEDLVREINDAVASHRNVTLCLEFVDANKLQLYLRAADLIALPYNDILNSGSAVLALSFDRPILVPNRGAMGELYEVMGPQWVRLYDGELTPQALRDAVIWFREKQADGIRTAPLEALGWDHIARLTMTAFGSL